MYKTFLSTQLKFFGTLLPLALVIGCAEPEAPTTEAGAKPIVHQAPKTDLKKTSTADPKATDDQDPKPKTGTPQSKDYTPPFPKRKTLFAPPKFKQTVVKSSNKGNDNLELSGFVDVDGPHAILNFGSEVQILKEGEKFQGITVLKIAPPNVTLQRGRIRWTVQLYDENE